MKQSQLFTKARKEAPKDEVSLNAQMLIRAGFIHKEIAGVYSFLPLGLRVFQKITNIIREEMNKIGGQEVQMTALQDKNIWEKTGRWDDKVVDVWFKTKLKNDTELGLGFTHEEQITHIMKDFISSYKDLPIYAYQIQTKFRNETRAKSGIMRMREFTMKDLYSFSKTNEEHNEFYEKSKIAYKNVFDRVGLGDKTYITYASGGTFSKYSHEFQTETEAGEDKIYICDICKVAINDEIIAEQNSCPVCNSKELRVGKGVEVGNIFPLGTKFSDALELTYVNDKGEKKPVIMGCYGIGPGRLMGTVCELGTKDNKMLWPKSISPFNVHLIEILSVKNENVKKTAEKLYEKLQKVGCTVLHDDRDMRAGEKFAEADLIGIPFRMVVSEKSIEAGGVEVKNVATGDVSIISEEDILSKHYLQFVEGN